ncbi:MAG: glycoside hydrolase family 15 protein [Acidobacteria bacterium]|nr:glycoside hydrolase family 15 protein [Acidobacteriota bacterium]
MNEPYAPIRDYALIGDCHGAALVSRTGSIDWCTFGRFDAAPAFCRILDATRGGSFSINPAGEFESERRYLEGTNILETLFRTSSGSVRLTDFMPVGRKPGSSMHDYVTLEAPFALVRILEGVEGTVPMKLLYDPTSDYGRHRSLLTTMKGGVTASDGTQLRTGIDFHVYETEGAAAQIELHAGDRRELLVYPAMARVPDIPVQQLLDVTRAFWEEWMEYSRYGGPHDAAVVRSAMALKLMTYAPTGALVASPLTSVPEAIGFGRNWDYRFCWMRDSALTLYALSVLGYSGEARRFGEYLMVACHASYPRLQIMYGIDSEAELPERSLDHLEGYAGSRPVRIGNGAYQQTQHDVPGEILDWAHLQRALGSRPRRRTRNFLAELADRTAENWSEPDSGLWEMRGEPMNHVYSKVMTWVTLDRATALTGSRKQKRGWRRTADEIVETVLARGIDPNRGTLMQSFESGDLDGSLLAIPFTGFPIDAGVFGRTVDAIREELSDGPFVYRYRTDDQLEGGEGAFLLCSFWLVDALLWLGREKEARDRLDELLAASNDVGLYSEEIDPDSKIFLGNFPQAFTHMAVIRTASLFELFEKEGVDGIRGSNTSRAKQLIGATSGPMALWDAFRQSGRLGRFWSSKQSMLKL